MGSLDPQAYAYAALSQSQHSGPSMDALQSMLLQAQCDRSVSSAGQVDLSQLLAHLPTPPGLAQVPPGLSPAASSPQQLLHHASSASSLQFDAAAADAWMQAAASGASSPSTGLPHDQANSGPRVFVPDSLKSNSAVAGSSPPSQHQLLLQAALAQQHQPAVPDTASMLPMLQEQLLLQALQQQQAATAAQAQQPNMQAALLAALSAGAAPPGVGQQPLGASLAGANTAGMWPFMPPGLTDTTAATAAAATAAALLAAQQQQQQQAALTRALASTGLMGATDPSTLLQQMLLAQQGLAGAAGAPAAASVLNQLQPWAIKALTAQMQQQGTPGFNPAAFNQLASLLSTTTASTGHIHRAGSVGAQGRRRSGRRSSGTAGAIGDYAGSFSGFAAASRANSFAGSDVTDMRTSSGLPAVLPAGVDAKDLCPSKYEDTWASTDAPADASAPAATATATSVSSDGSCQLARNSSSASTSSIESSAGASACGSAASLSTSGRQGSGESGAGDKWQWDSHFCSLDDDAASQGSSGVSGRACRKEAADAAADAKQGSNQAEGSDDTQGSKDQAPADRKGSAADAAAGCPVWIPGEREVAGDDSWYLPRPPTCRLFVGNIGCWVDESMLLGYFGKYGHVVDVQVGQTLQLLLALLGSGAVRLLASLLVPAVGCCAFLSSSC